MKRIICTVITLLSISVGCYAETFNDAYRALKRLEARTESGISYLDYPAALGDARFTVKMYLEESTHDQQRKGIAEAMEHYENAMLFWSSVERYRQNYLPTDSKAGKEFIPRLAAVYPDAVKPTTDGGLVHIDSIKLYDGKTVPTSTIVFSEIAQYAWAKSAAILKQFSPLIK